MQVVKPSEEDKAAAEAAALDVDVTTVDDPVFLLSQFQVIAAVSI